MMTRWVELLKARRPGKPLPSWNNRSRQSLCFYFLKALRDSAKARKTRAKPRRSGRMAARRKAG